MFSRPPAQNPELLHVSMVAQQQNICLAKVPNYDKELKKIEKDFKYAQ